MRDLRLSSNCIYDQSSDTWIVYRHVTTTSLGSRLVILLLIILLHFQLPPDGWSLQSSILTHQLISSTARATCCHAITLKAFRRPVSYYVFTPRLEGYSSSPPCAAHLRMQTAMRFGPTEYWMLGRATSALPCLKLIFLTVSQLSLNCILQPFIRWSSPNHFTCMPCTSVCCNEFTVPYFELKKIMCLQCYFIEDFRITTEQFKNVTLLPHLTRLKLING